jgi:hypothetical protein
MKHTTQIIVAGCAAAALLLAIAPNASALNYTKGSKASPSPAASAAAATAKASPATSASPTSTRAIPFKGMISAVDEKGKTFTIAGKEKSRTFKITDQSLLTKADKPATMKDVTVNEEVRGSYWKKADGSLEAKKIKLGPLTDAEKAAEDARKSKRAEKKAAKAAASSSASPAASASPKP